MLKLLTLASLLTTIVPATANAYCKGGSGLEPGIVSPSNIEIPIDGGIVVAAVTADIPLAPGDQSVQPTWRLHHGARRDTPNIVMLAPGLAVYRSTASTGRIDLEDAQHTSIAFVTATSAKTKPLAAPVLKRVELVSAQGFTHIDVDVADKAPAGAIAIVLADASGTPRSWQLVQKTSTHQQGYAQNKCAVVPNGSVLSQPGDEVTSFWVDAAGRPSRISQRITVR